MRLNLTKTGVVASSAAALAAAKRAFAGSAVPIHASVRGLGVAREVRRTWRGRATYYNYGCAGGGLVSKRHLRRACVALLGIKFVVWVRQFHDKGQRGGGDDGDGQVCLRQLGCRRTPLGLDPHAHMASASALCTRGACGVRAGAPLWRPPPRQRRPTAQAHILGGWGCRLTAQAHTTGSAGRRLRHTSWVLRSGSVARARMHVHFLTPCPASGTLPKSTSAGGAVASARCRNGWAVSGSKRAASASCRPGRPSGRKLLRAPRWPPRPGGPRWTTWLRRRPGSCATWCAAR